jgi:uncharacterized protein YfaP (DUF2135 family)
LEHPEIIDTAQESTAPQMEMVEENYQLTLVMPSSIPDMNTTNGSTSEMFAMDTPMQGRQER